MTIQTNDVSIIVKLGFGIPVIERIATLSFSNWDMSTNKFPSNSLKGNPYFGINGPTTTLYDTQNPPQPIPNGVIAWPLVDNASTTDASQWALQYTITS